MLEPDAAATLPRLAAAFDEPLGDEAALPLFLICEAARREVTVALVGDGGDESFAGYERYAAMALAERVPAPVASAGARLLRALPGATARAALAALPRGALPRGRGRAARRALRAAHAGLPARASAPSSGATTRRTRSARSRPPGFLLGPPPARGHRRAPARRRRDVPAGRPAAEVRHRVDGALARAALAAPRPPRRRARALAPRLAEVGRPRRARSRCGARSPTRCRREVAGARQERLRRSARALVPRRAAAARARAAARRAARGRAAGSAPDAVERLLAEHAAGRRRPRPPALDARHARALAAHARRGGRRRSPVWCASPTSTGCGRSAAPSATCSRCCPRSPSAGSSPCSSGSTTRPGIRPTSTTRSRVPAVRLPGAARPRSAPARASSCARCDADVVHTHLVHADVYGGARRDAARRTRLVSTKHNDDPFRAGPFRFVERGLARARRPRRHHHRLAAPLHRRARRAARGEGGDDPLRARRAAGAVGREPARSDVPAARACCSRCRGSRRRRASTSPCGRSPSLPGGRRARRARRGPERESLETLARELGVDVARAPARAACRTSPRGCGARRVLVHPARWEGFGLAVLEAMVVRPAGRGVERQLAAGARRRRRDGPARPRRTTRPRSPPPSRARSDGRRRSAQRRASARARARSSRSRAMADRTARRLYRAACSAERVPRRAAPSGRCRTLQEARERALPPGLAHRAARARGRRRRGRSRRASGSASPGGTSTPGLAVADDLAEAADRRGDHRPRALHRLERDHAEALAHRRDDDDRRLARSRPGSA